MGVYEGQIIWISNGSAKQWVKMGGREGASTSDRSQHFQQLSVSLSVCLPGRASQHIELVSGTELATHSRYETRSSRHAAQAKEWMNEWMDDCMNGSRNRTDVCKVDVHITSTRLLVFPLRILVEPSQRVVSPLACPSSLATNCCTVQWVCVSAP